MQKKDEHMPERLYTNVAMASGSVGPKRGSAQIMRALAIRPSGSDHAQVVAAAEPLVPLPVGQQRIFPSDHSRGEQACMSRASHDGESP